MEWIKVSDRLPEFDLLVITCDKKGNVYPGSLEEICACWDMKGSRMGWCFDQEQGHYASFEEVLYWMPLPAPPEQK